jgi:PIN domain nuclease of toxin-antitoxin system
VSDVVLDASAVLALLNAEEGADLVQESLPHAIVSTVNYGEVVARLSLLGMPDDEIHTALDMLGLDIIPFDDEQAFQSGIFASQTRSLGLSLGDRACLALALKTQSVALTADRAWKKLKVGVEIHLIR